MAGVQSRRLGLGEWGLLRNGLRVSKERPARLQKYIAKKLYRSGHQRDLS